VGGALYLRRRRTDVHKQLMLIAAITQLDAAIARIPLAVIENGGYPSFFLA
jgi:hypothetical protein